MIRFTLGSAIGVHRQGTPQVLTLEYATKPDGERRVAELTIPTDDALACDPLQVAAGLEALATALRRDFL